MTAYELAELLEDYSDDYQHEPAAKMLRQQADRIAELEKQLQITERLVICMKK